MNYTQFRKFSKVIGCVICVIVVYLLFLTDIEIKLERRSKNESSLQFFEEDALMPVQERDKHSVIYTREDFLRQQRQEQSQIDILGAEQDTTTQKSHLSLTSKHLDLGLSETPILELGENPIGVNNQLIQDKFLINSPKNLETTSINLTEYNPFIGKEPSFHYYQNQANFPCQKDKIYKNFQIYDLDKAFPKQERDRAKLRREDRLKVWENNQIKFLAPPLQSLDQGWAKLKISRHSTAHLHVLAH